MIRAIFNIANNAADAMQDGGSFTIRTSRENKYLSLSFTDTGTGIPEDIRSKVLLPFFTYGKTLGTGLGLSIVKKIVDDHQGRVEIDSELNRGTTIRLLVPLPSVQH
jgi:signal transduction histidine kinase